MQRPEDVLQRFQDAWNAHDMDALGALFHADARFVNRFAHFVRGIPDIVAMHDSIHKTIYSDSTLSADLIDVTPLVDGAAAVHFWCRLNVGPAHPAGPHTIDTLILAVMTRQDGAWLIKALENVTLANPRTGAPVLRGNPDAPAP